MNLNDLPSFLKESQLYDVLSENYENGIIDQNELNQLNQYIISNDKVENIEEFKKVFDVEHYWGVDDYSLSLYAYSIFYRDEVLNYLLFLVVSEGQSEKYKSFYDDIFHSTFILENPRLMIKYLERNYKKSPELNEICNDLLKADVRLKLGLTNLLIYFNKHCVADIAVQYFFQNEEENPENNNPRSEGLDVNLLKEDIENKRNSVHYLFKNHNTDKNLNDLYLLSDKNLIIIKPPEIIFQNQVDFEEQQRLSYFQIQLSRFNIPNILFDLNSHPDLLYGNTFWFENINNTGFDNVTEIPNEIAVNYSISNDKQNFNQNGYTYARLKDIMHLTILE